MDSLAAVAKCHATLICDENYEREQECMRAGRKFRPIGGTRPGKISPAGFLTGSEDESGLPGLCGLHGSVSLCTPGCHFDRPVSDPNGKSAQARFVRSVGRFSVLSDQSVINVQRKELDATLRGGSSRP